MLPRVRRSLDSGYSPLANSGMTIFTRLPRYLKYMISQRAKSSLGGFFYFNKVTFLAVNPVSVSKRHT